MQQCIDYAVSHNIDVQKRAVEVSQRDITLNTSKKAWLPDLNLKIQHLYGFENPVAASSGSNVSFNNASGSVTLPVINSTMPLFDGFKIKNQIQADKYSLMSAAADLEGAKKDISIQVASYYLQCLYYKGMADVARKQVETSRELVKRAAMQVEEGKRPQSEQADAEAQLASDEQVLVNDEGQYTLALLTLAHALNIPDLQNFRIVEDERGLTPLPDSTLQMPQTIYDGTVDSWPSIMSAKAGVRQSEYLLKENKGDFYPQLSLYGSIGTVSYTVFNKSDLNLGSFWHQFDYNRGEIIGLVLTYPIFNRFQTRNKVRKASNDIINKRLALEDAKLKLRKDIETAYQNAVLAQQKLNSSEKSCEANRISMEYEEIRYTEGRSSIFDLLQARQKYFKAQQDAVQAKYELLIRERILDFYK
jgi:outer membrane protein